MTHDRHVLDRVTNKVLEIDRGATYLHVPHGTDGRIRVRGVPRGAHRTRSAGRDRGADAQEPRAPRARVAAARRAGAHVEAEGAHRRRQRAPRARPAASAREGELGLSLGSTRLGSKGVELHGVGFSWPRRARDGDDAGSLLVLKPFDHMLEPGDRVGIVGPNGAGKSTLLDLIAGRLQPTQGSIEIGRTVKIGYYDQLGRDLDLTQRVRDAVAGDKGEPTLDDVKLMRQFWFDGDTQFAPISTLSGGERRRLQLLLTLIEQPNVLLLDEPTNDLDLDTLRALEDFLDDWPGIVVVVSHDRVFLDRTVSEVLALDGNGRAAVVRGGVAGWLAQHAAQPTAAPVRPARRRPRPRRAAARRHRRRSPCRRRARARCATSWALADRELADAIAARDAVQAELVAAGADHEELARLGEQLAAQPGPRRRRRRALALTRRRGRVTPHGDLTLSRTCHVWSAAGVFMTLATQEERSCPASHGFPRPRSPACSGTF